MIILNTTFYVHESIDNQFHRWIDEVYIPLAIKDGLESPSISRILMAPQEGMSGYAVQVFCDSMESAQTWHDEKSAAAREALSSRYGQKILFFTTYMERLRP